MLFGQIETTPDLSNVIEANQDISYTTILLIVIGVFVARFITKQVLYKVVDRAMRSHKYVNKKERYQRRDTLVSVFNTMLTVLYIVTGFILILNELGVNLQAVITAVGALGVVLGIAAQSAIKDFLTGMSILFYDQMRVGDIVEIGGKSGVVTSITLQIVRLRDLDGYVHVIPNSEITVVTNMSHNYANVNLDIGVAYDSDVDKVEKIINDVGASMAEDEDWKDIILEPIEYLRLDSFGDSSVNIKALGKVQPGEQWAVAGEYRRRLKKAFEKNGIEIPFPQRVIHQAK